EPGDVRGDDQVRQPAAGQRRVELLAQLLVAGTAVDERGRGVGVLLVPQVDDGLLDVLRAARVVGPGLEGAGALLAPARAACGGGRAGAGAARARGGAGTGHAEK